ncbi:MAG: MBL fold metallo-hydrolase, partial [Hyphomicrobium sp.]
MLSSRPTFAPARIAMPRNFDPHLVNDPFGDPGLYVDLVFERRALLFDLGDLSKLSPRSLLRISDVFVSHRHMDHFMGFDQLLRCILGRETTVGFYGSTGLIEAIEHKLKAYTWNLIARYEGNPVLRVIEIDADGRLTSAEFPGRLAFARAEDASAASHGFVLLQEPSFLVRATRIEHGVPALAFALEERAHINIWRNKVEAMGLAVGRWLGAFKEAILRGSPEDTPIEVAWTDARGERPESLPLGALKREIMRITAGRKIAYVVDCAFTEANVARVVALAKDADVLFIEAAFLQEDCARAAERQHLTAHQA